MLKPTVQVHNENGILVAEFWDCLRLDPGRGARACGRSTRRTFAANGRVVPELVIDLLGVGFAGSASLGHFVALHRIARPKNGRLIFCNVDPRVHEVFKVSKLEPLFVFVADQAAALAEYVPNPCRAAPKGSAGAFTGRLRTEATRRDCKSAPPHGARRLRE